MSTLSKLVVGRALVILLALTLGVFGVQALHAKGQSCPTHASNCAPQSCPTASNCEVVDKHAQHEAEEAQKRAQKAAEHARHEAEEECARQQKAYEHAQHEAAEARERAEAKQPACNECAPAPTCNQCAPRCEHPQETTSVIVVQPAPQPTPEPFPEGLPKTASPMGLLGLVGVLSVTALGIRFRR